MKEQRFESSERLIRVLAQRRGKQVELRVHYERAHKNGCDTYTLFRVEDVDPSTNAIA